MSYISSTFFRTPLPNMECVKGNLLSRPNCGDPPHGKRRMPNFMTEGRSLIGKLQMAFRVLFQIMVTVLCLWTLSSGATLADENHNPVLKTKVERHINRRIFFAFTAALATSSSFDWTTTVHCIQRGCYELGSRWALGRIPNNRDIVGFASAEFAGQTTTFYFTERSRYRWLRWAGRSYLAYTVGMHLVAGLRNRGICQPASNCGRSQ
jgi:hypothetical protein